MKMKTLALVLAVFSATAALSEADFFKTPNVVSKRVLQYGGEAVIRVEVDVSKLKTGERAGLALYNGGKDFALTYGQRTGNRVICEWRVKGKTCVSSLGENVELAGAGYRGINFGLYTTGAAAFRVLATRFASSVSPLQIPLSAPYQSPKTRVLVGSAR